MYLYFERVEMKWKNTELTRVMVLNLVYIR